MRRIFVLLCVCAGLSLLAGVPVDRSRLVKTARVERPSMQSAPTLAASNVSGTRICLFHLWDWNEDEMGNVTVSANDPYYAGGWTTTITAGAAGEMVFEGGLAMFDVSQPFTVNGSTVTLTVDGEPFATVSGSKTTTTGDVTTTVDSTLYYYVVNEDWLVNYGDYADVHGTIQSDGTILFNEGFAYYIEREVTTTTTVGNHSQVLTDSSFDMSLLIRDMKLLPPNGIHDYKDNNGQTHSVSVYLRQSDDNVYVTNLWGLGWEENCMVLAEGGVMTFPGQPICDISDAANPAGAGLWYNASDNNGTLGNVGNATPSMITWGLTVPTDNATVWPGWTDNRIYFTNGSQFVIPVSPVGMRGDVNGDGAVNISDVTALINYLLTDNAEGLNLGNADCNLDENLNISDVTTLINFLLTDQWGE